MKKKHLWVGAGLLTLIFVGWWAPVDDWILTVVSWIERSGNTGIAVYAAVYVTAALLLLPGSVLTMTAGFAWGPILGVMVVSPVSVLAATAAFLLGRSVARDWIANRIAGNPRFAAIDEAVARDGFKVVLLLRLSPLFPFNLLNYAMGLTRVSTRDYMLASFLGMLPGTILYVYLGSLVTSVATLLSSDIPSAGPWTTVLYAAGLVATVLVTVVITRTARTALDSYLAPESRN